MSGSGGSSTAQPRLPTAVALGGPLSFPFRPTKGSWNTGSCLGPAMHQPQLTGSMETAQPASYVWDTWEGSRSGSGVGSTAQLCPPVAAVRGSPLSSPPQPAAGSGLPLPSMPATYPLRAARVQGNRGRRDARLACTVHMGLVLRFMRQFYT